MLAKSIVTEAEALISAHPLISDCAVLSRAADGQTDLMAFVVPVRPMDAAQLVETLRDARPDFALPAAIVPVTAIPLRPDGSVDEMALRALPVASAANVARAEAALASYPGVEHAAVFLVPRSSVRHALHMDDLLPGGSAAVDSQPTVEIVGTGDDGVEERANSPAALVKGLSLNDQDALPATLADTLARAIVAHPQALIKYLNDDGTENAQSYSELRTEALRITAGLRAAHLDHGDFVIAQLTQSRDILPFFWGCVLGGFVPLIAATPASYAAGGNEIEKLGHVWRLLGRPLIVTSPAHQQALVEAGAAFDLTPTRVASIATLRQHEAASEPRAAQPDDIAFVNLSSGSTGIPKCIQLTHRNVLSRARGTNVLCGHEPADVILNWLPFDHIGSISDWHVRCVDLGCDMVYCSKERILGQPLEWLRTIDRHRISHSWAPNFAYALINAALSGAGSERWDLSSMKSLLTAGEAVSSSTVEELLTRLREHGLRRTAVRTAFGMAELGSGITYSQPTDEHPVTAVTVNRSSLKGRLRPVAPDHPRAITFVSLGPIIAGMSMRIVDDESRILPEMTIGRLHVQGEAVSPGYYANDEANQVFLADGWFETGDQGFIANGQLYLTGRSKDCIIVNGANYFPTEIEKAVEDLPGVEVSFTAAYTVRPAGSQREQVALFFCPVDDRDPALSTLLRAIQQRVTQKIGLKADYLVPLSKHDVPKTAIGKIQRKQLAASFEAGAFAAATRRADLLLRNERTLPDWFAVPCWRPRALRSAWFDESERTPVVLMDEAGLGLRLLERLGERAVRVDHGGEPAKLAERYYRTDATNVDQLAAVFEQISQDQAAHLHVIDMRRYGTPPLAWDTAAEQAVRALPMHLRIVLEALTRTAAGNASLRFTVVASNSQPVDTDDRLCPARCIEPALIAAEAAADNGLSARHIDIEPLRDASALDAIAEDLALELSHVTGDGEVAYRNGRRLVPRLEKVDFAAPIPGGALKAKGLYVVTGGLGGLGNELVRMLLSRFAARVLLVGRSPLAGQEDARSARLNALRALGPVDYEALDVASAEGAVALKQRVESAEAKFGAKLAGVFHLAGTFGEGRLSETSDAEIWAVLAPKIMGALALEELIRDRPDVLLVHYSSAASQFPTETMPAYAAANRFLDAHTQHRRHVNGGPCWSAGFSAWTDVGMNAEGASEAVLRSRGLSVLNPRQGLNSLLALLARAPGTALVGILPDASTMQSLMSDAVAPTHDLSGYYTARAADLPGEIAVDTDGRRALMLKVERLQTVPLTATGALDREQLKKQVAGPGGSHVLPEGPIEELLLKIWQNVLRAPGIGVTDDFFMLGGHSLLAAELVQRINDTCNTALPLNVMFEAPTIRAQATLLNMGCHAHAASIIPLQPLGSEPPLFCICGITLYSALARCLAPDVPVYGVLLSVEGQLVTGKDATLNVRDMARDYVTALRAKQPHGPYRVLGLSFGAVLAYEIAQQLSADGHEVEVLAMLDFVLPEGRSRSLVRSAARKLSNVSQIPDLLQRIARDLSERVRARAMGFIAPPPITQPAAEIDVGVVRFRAYKQAYSEYEGSLKPYDGSAMVFRAADQIVWDGFEVAQDCGWSRYVRGELQTFDVPGDHLSMLQEPNVQALAAHLASTLAQRSAVRSS